MYNNSPILYKWSAELFVNTRCMICLSGYYVETGPVWNQTRHELTMVLQIPQYSQPTIALLFQIKTKERQAHLIFSMFYLLK